MTPDRGGASAETSKNEARPGAQSADAATAALARASRIGVEAAQGSAVGSGYSPAFQNALTAASRGVEHRGLAEILEDDWAFRLRHSPEFATRQGVHDFDHLLARSGPKARALAQAQRERQLVALELIDSEALSEQDRLNYESFRAQLKSAAARSRCRYAEWNISTRTNAVSSVFSLVRRHRVETVADGRNLVSRLALAAERIDISITDLRRGLADGWVANCQSLERLLASLDTYLKQDVSDSPLSEPARVEHASWSPTDLQAFRSDLARRVQQELIPAMRRYRRFVAEELLPAARGPNSVGLLALPGGQACYAALVEHYTTLDLGPRELHELGKSEIARINREMRTLGRRLLGTGQLSSVLSRLRNDPALYFSRRDEVRNFAEAALREAETAMSKAFSHAPGAACEVTVIPDEEAPFATIAYYSRPSPDASKPGEYFINTFEPQTRPRYEARVLAYHEAVPGHHLQIAWAQELGELPAFRRFGGQTVFVEGWALYAERLADEMGLYHDDLDRMGVLSFDAWRAARLVVDTGIHSFGWTRSQAIDYLTRHTALAANNIETEVDRYIGWPGQALAYKVGQLEILKLRKQAKQKLGERFSLAEFHDVVLGAGALSMPDLKRRVQAYIQAAERN